MSLTFGVRHIWDIPDEILLEILLHANAREREVWGNSSERCNRLVFKNKKLLRNLDFAYEGCLTSALNIQQYFDNKNINEHILTISDSIGTKCDVHLLAELEVNEVWNLGPLCLIQGRENLESLRLLFIPICDGKFLIEIVKQCKSLLKLEFCNLGPSQACCYAKELSLMLSHCQNLTDFSMYASNIGQVSDVFVSLAENLQLRSVPLTSFGEANNTVNLVSSVEQLLHCCSKLTTFVYIIDRISQVESDQLTSALRGSRTELHRPALQFQVIRKSNSEAMSTIDTVCEDSSPPSFPYTVDKFTHF